MSPALYMAFAANLMFLTAVIPFTVPRGEGNWKTIAVVSIVMAWEGVFFAVIGMSNEQLRGIAGISMIPVVFAVMFGIMAFLRRSSEVPENTETCCKPGECKCKH